MSNQAIRPCAQSAVGSASSENALGQSLQKQTRPKGAGYSDALRRNIVRNCRKTMVSCASATPGAIFVGRNRRLLHAIFVFSKGFSNRPDIYARLEPPAAKQPQDLRRPQRRQNSPIECLATGSDAPRQQEVPRPRCRRGRQRQLYRRQSPTSDATDGFAAAGAAADASAARKRRRGTAGRAA